MRAPYPVVIALAVAAGTAPGYGLPFWHKHNAAPTARVQSQPIPAWGEDNLIAQATRPAPGAAPRPNVNGPGPHQGDWLRQFSNLPQAQQEQKLRNDPMFRSLTPDKKQKILNRMETYEHLPPEKQAQAQTLFQQYEGLPADQRSQVSQAYRKLRQMSPDQRAQYFNSDEFRSNFNDQQRDLLRGMAELYPSQVR